MEGLVLPPPTHGVRLSTNDSGLFFMRRRRAEPYKENTTIATSTSRIARDGGRVMKRSKLPPDMSMDRLNSDSIMGPRTNANTRGVGSYLNFFNRYPTMPNKK